MNLKALATATLVASFSLGAVGCVKKAGIKTGDSIKSVQVPVSNSTTGEEPPITVEVKCDKQSVNIVDFPVYSGMWMTSQGSYDIAYQQAVSDGKADIAGLHGSYIQGIVNSAISQACNA